MAIAGITVHPNEPWMKQMAHKVKENCHHFPCPTLGVHSTMYRRHG